MAFGCSCSEPQGSVNLVFDTDSRGQFRGFDCRSETEIFWTRASNQAERVTEFSLVIDFVLLGGEPDCRAGQLFDWCANSGSCQSSMEHRACFPIRVDGVGIEGLNGFKEALDTRTGEEVVADAPDQPLLIRAIGTTLPCSEALVMETLPCGSLVGCVHSCPVNLDRIDGTLLLDLDVGSNRCAAEVERCASPTLTSDQACTP